MTPAVRELEAAGVAFTVHEYERGESLRDFGVEAADKLGLDPDQVFKTLLVTADGAQAVAIVPVSGKLSLKSVGKALGAKHVDMCDPDVAERVTGYVRGGISPFGQKKRLPTVIDEIATLFDTSTSAAASAASTSASPRRPVVPAYSTPRRRPTSARAQTRRSAAAACASGGAASPRCAPLGPGRRV